MLYLVWAIGIALSTLMIRKHFLIDSFSGIVMATLSYNLFVSGKLTKPLFDTIDKSKTIWRIASKTNMPANGLVIIQSIY